MKQVHDPTRRGRNTLSLKIGAWFEAQASGWGILAIPATLVLLGLLSSVWWLSS